jgi:putative FmdB family regulatory protein
MPTYDYVCRSCGHAFEEFQSITAKPLKQCPACDARALQRLIGTGAGVLFKGSGFYQTDYRSESYKKAAEAEKKSKTETAKKSESKGSEKGGGKPKAEKPAA